MKLTMRSTRPGIAREGGSVYVEVTLDPGSPVGGRKVTRRPVALCLVFDRSGSMGGPAGATGLDYGTGCSPVGGYGPAYRPVPPRPGYPRVHGRTKMDYVKAAAHVLVDNLREGEYVALVSFSHTGRVEVPMTPVNPWSRNMLHHAIEAFRPEDSTNLFEGLVLGEREFGSALPSTHSCKIVLLSDGLANVGVTSPGGMADFALSLSRRGVTVSALGVGLDYSAEIMGTLAQCGGGHFYHIAEAYRLPEIVLGELESAAVVPARRVSLEIGAGPMVAVGENLNLYHQVPGPNGVVVHVGDLVGPWNIVFEISTPVGFGGEAVPVRAVCRWEDEAKVDREAAETLTLPALRSEEVEVLPIDAALVAEVARLLEARTTRLASGAYDMGDHVRTQAEVRAGTALLARMATGAPEVDRPLAQAQARLRDLAGRFDRHDVTSAEVKDIYSEAFESTAGPRPGRKPGPGGKKKP